MNFLYSLPLAVTPAPDETLAPGVDPKDVTPGLLGFIFTLFMVIAIIFLIRDMTKRIRRVRYREQVATELLERESAAGRDGRTAAPASSGQNPAEGSHPSDPDSSGKHLH